MLCDDCHSSLDFIPSSLYTHLPTILATQYNELKNLRELHIPATPQPPKLAPWLDLCFRVCVLFSCYSECMQFGNTLSILLLWAVKGMSFQY